MMILPWALGYDYYDYNNFDILTEQKKKQDSQNMYHKE